MKWSLKVLCHSGIHLEINNKSTPKTFVNISKLKNTSYNQPTYQSQNENG